MTDKLEIRQYVVGMVGTNCYIAVNRQTKEALVIDPGAQGAALADTMKQDGLKPVAVLLTHGHFDHVSGIKSIKENLPPQIMI